MKAVAQKRARIARVRHIQHVQATAAAAAAQGQLVHLETSAERLGALRGSLAFTPGISNGASLSSIAELAMRLDNARDGLADAIVSARIIAAERAEERLEARCQKESASRLGSRAAAALADLIEQRISAGRPHRPSLKFAGDEE